MAQLHQSTTLPLGRGELRSALTDMMIDWRAIWNAFRMHAFNSGALAIHGSASALAKTASTVNYSFPYGSPKQQVAADMAALSGTVANGAFNVFVFGINSAGTLTTTMGTAGATLGAVVFPSFTPTAQIGISSVLTASAATSTTLTDSTQAWTTNQYAGYEVIIIAGTGSGQRRIVTSNTATALTVPAWTTTPDTTSTYAIYSPLTAVFGYVIINPTGTGNFVGGTTALDDGTVVPNAVYVNTPFPFLPGYTNLSW